MIMPTAGSRLLEFAQESGQYPNEYQLFCNSGMVDRKFLETAEDNPNIEILLLNSAPFSRKTKSDIKDHYATDEMIASAKEKSGSCIKLALMHHRLDWFDDDSKRYLERELRHTCDMLLVGHDHENDTEIIERRDRNSWIMLRGGEIDLSGYGESNFSIYNVDTDQQKLIETIYRWTRTDASCALVR